MCMYGPALAVPSELHVVSKYIQASVTSARARLMSLNFVFAQLNGPISRTVAFTIVCAHGYNNDIGCTHWISPRNSKRQVIRPKKWLQHACCLVGGAPTLSAPLLPASAPAPGGVVNRTGAPSGPDAAPVPPGTPAAPGRATATVSANVDRDIQEGSSAPPPSKSKSALPLAAIVGGGVGAVVLLAAVLLIIFRNKLCSGGKSHGGGQAFSVEPPKTYTNPVARPPSSVRKLFGACFPCGTTNMCMYMQQMRRQRQLGRTQVRRSRAVQIVLSDMLMGSHEASFRVLARTQKLLLTCICTVCRHQPLASATTQISKPPTRHPLCSMARPAPRRHPMQQCLHPSDSPLCPPPPPPQRIPFHLGQRSLLTSRPALTQRLSLLAQ
jgi:hypothetical protein